MNVAEKVLKVRQVQTALIFIQVRANEILFHSAGYQDSPEGKILAGIQASLSACRELLNKDETIKPPGWGEHVACEGLKP